ncbi:Anaerobic nitric oxide reductase flavorubredoxin [Mycobacterium intracellulare subsp. intracellulare MTCC 9506]|uniref:Anaerobic nitric oxide reductase flavorubredoxin n=1 Tax=Mycobacterium indicus pranii (strain DSM 45239 / MTCC 9506) TaxID=1232724 RepID=J9W9H3_MYCIP|nr:Anaerobic nitric oxide reductase flavorubredoxin [Mycobacterium intracellulare subsp. intracellulare MTCC 9506]
MGPIHVVITNAACREDGAKSDRQNSTPATTQVEPLQTVHPGPSQAVTARRPVAPSAGSCGSSLSQLLYAKASLPDLVLK